jgi:hypothetical protein
VKESASSHRDVWQACGYGRTGTQLSVEDLGILERIQDVAEKEEFRPIEPRQQRLLLASRFVLDIGSFIVSQCFSFRQLLSVDDGTPTKCISRGTLEPHHAIDPARWHGATMFPFLPGETQLCCAP